MLTDSPSFRLDVEGTKQCSVKEFSFPVVSVIRILVKVYSAFIQEIYAHG